MLIQRGVIRDLLQIPDRVPVKNQVRIPQRIVINQIVQFGFLVQILRNFVFHPNDVDGDHGPIYVPQFHTGGIHVEFAG